MITPRQKYEVCRVKSGMAIFKQNTPQFRFYISTRTNNIIVKANDIDYNYVTSKNIDFTQTTVSASHSFLLNTGLSGIYDVYVKFLGGLKDVYSISISTYYNENVVYIPNWENFIMQFQNLYSIDFQKNHLPITITGDLSKIPNSVEVVRFLRLNRLNNDFYLNITNFNTASKLNNLSILDTVQPLLVFGDLTHLPTSVNFFNIVQCASGSSITYTAGKVWASNFDTLSIPLVLTTPELDSLLADMDGSIMTKTGAGVISIGGYRSSASDAYVASLQAKGFTVNVSRQYKLLDLPFQNNLTDSGEMGITMVAGGTSNQPTFALSGRKAGEYCAVFNGSQSIKTTTNLPLNSDKVTIAFWMKTTQTTHAKVVNLFPGWNTSNRFAVGINDGAKLRAISGQSPNVCDYNGAVNDSTWRHFVITFNRSLLANQEIKLYINGIQATTTNAISNNGTGNFINDIIEIGSLGNSLVFNGSISKLKIYNYPFAPSEVTNLYNSEL